MIDVTATGTTEAFPTTGVRVHMPAGEARLRAILRRNLDERPSGPLKLVAKHLGEAGPSRVRDTTRQAPSNHSCDVELLEHDYAVALGESRRLNVQEVRALASHFSVQTHDAKCRLLSVLGFSLSSRDNSLRTSKSRHGVFVKLRVRCESTVRISEHESDTTINSNDWCSSRKRSEHLDLTHNQRVPLISVSLQRASLRFTFERPMDNSAQVTEFRESQNSAIESPCFWVRFGKAEKISLLALPSRGSRKSLETKLPSLVEFDEKLSANVSRHIGKPRRLETKFLQIVDLIERCRVVLLRHRKSKQPVLVREIPKPTKGRFPRHKSGLLRRCRVDAIAKGLTGQHRVDFGLPVTNGPRPRSSPSDAGAIHL